MSLICTSLIRTWSVSYIQFLLYCCYRFCSCCTRTHTLLIHGIPQVTNSRTTPQFSVCWQRPVWNLCPNCWLRGSQKETSLETLGQSWVNTWIVDGAWILEACVLATAVYICTVDSFRKLGSALYLVCLLVPCFVCWTPVSVIIR